MAGNSAKTWILNLGGEGELAGAINLNNLSAPLRSIPVIRAQGPLVICDMLQRWPFADGTIDAVVANRLPGFAPKELKLIALQARRVLRIDGEVRLWSESSPASVLAEALRRAGLRQVSVSKLAACGIK